jgi:ketosteroid isomerase-like protein
VAEQGNRDIIEAWIHAVSTRDLPALHRLYAPDAVQEWPQTGERLVGVETILAVDDAYPGGLPKVEQKRLLGSEDRWVLDAAFVPRRIVGSGDVWVLEATMTYPAGDVWEYAGILELRDGRIRRQTEYWAPRSEPPAWREGLTERTR